MGYYRYRGTEKMHVMLSGKRKSFNKMQIIFPNLCQTTNWNFERKVEGIGEGKRGFSLHSIILINYFNHTGNRKGLYNEHLYTHCPDFSTTILVYLGHTL
jgi:hypothetical protein